MEVSVLDEVIPARVGHAVSWGAIFGGAATALVLWIWLAAGGLAVGLGSASPHGTDVGALGEGVGIWTLLSPILALFAGGLLVGRLTGSSRRLDAALNGVIAWAVTMIALFYLLGTGVGAVVGGAFGAAGSSLKALASGASKIDVGSLDLNTSGLADKANQYLRSTGKPELQPEQIRKMGKSVIMAYVRGGSDSAAGVAKADASRVGGAVDRDAVVKAIAANTDLSREEAGKLYDNLKTDLDSLAGEARQQIDQLTEQAKQAGAKAANAAAKGLWGLVAAMFLALMAAAGGAAAGAPGWFVRSENPSVGGGRKETDPAAGVRDPILPSNPAPLEH